MSTLPLFDGRTYNAERDGKRLGELLSAVKKVMSDGQWHTLGLIEGLLANYHGVYSNSASISARIRDLRKPKFGGYTIERRYVADGVWEYRLSGGEHD